MSEFTRRTLLSSALALGVALGVAAPVLAAEQTIKVGVMSGAEEEVAQVVKKVAATKGLNVQLVPFSDYALVNEALARGDLDANAFQHKPYLEAQIAARGYKIVPVGFTFVQPIGLYSKKVKAVADLPKGAKIGIPNDPSNGGRALNLLAAQGLIKLKDGKGLSPTLLDIADNPKNLAISELDAAQLPRALPDLDAAVINTDHALNGGLDIRKDTIAVETREGNPYANFVAARQGDENRPEIKTFVASYQSQDVAAFLDTRFKGAIIPAW
ncbi:MetQ/NlpA family ABC transporter substrate-binding protein [Microvirga rosea]|uniref:MetQ/NlpA family ABC transporter substrate-binding protein n=1 Tax=Microvirga rosea TaxID=2715425 RepID=UPI001D09F3B6|nr:MetQ/NlpA family ABC transporter substrate-binding protein [Microvirga rosea]MCB8820304.1 MetQ/NlpA family ABC transporter substrate-binding protein [Microvirga rosea]